jgi:hypothetical protein
MSLKSTSPLDSTFNDADKNRKDDFSTFKKLHELSLLVIDQTLLLAHDQGLGHNE